MKEFNKMLCYKDTTFCASDGCKNDCGRALSQEQREDADRKGLPISWGWFCGLPGQGDVGKKEREEVDE